MLSKVTLQLLAEKITELALPLLFPGVSREQSGTAVPAEAAGWAWTALLGSEQWCKPSDGAMVHWGSRASRRRGHALTTEDRWHQSLLPIASPRESRHSCLAPNT